MGYPAFRRSRAFQRTVLSGGGNLTTTSTSKTPIDATTLAYKSLTCDVDDVVVCTFVGTIRNSSAGQGAGFDFEVDRPTSANVYVADGVDYGVWEAESPGGGTRFGVTAIGSFLVTEAGVHGFRPVWLTSGGTLTLCNATSGQDDVLVLFMAENIGPLP